MRALSLYIHVPFCTRRCPYCSFYHVPVDRGLESPFVGTIAAEIEHELRALGEPVALETVYVGGGTPSVLSPASLAALFEAVDPWRDSGATREVTIELNPEDVTVELLERLREHGVNRVSLGVQSMDADAQASLGRCPPGANRTAIERVGRVFDNASVDVLVGIPGGTPEALRATVSELAGYRPAHVSLYCLEPGGDMGRSVGSFFAGVDPDRSADEYLWACDRLRAEGYVHYEASNFAVAGRESLHNRVYWEGGEYLGVGPAAHSMIGDRRFQNPPSLRDYLARTPGREPPGRIEDRGAGGELEALMLGLRTNSGVARGRCPCGDGVLLDLEERGLTLVESGRVRLTDRGFLMLNDIVCRVLREGGASAAASEHGRAA